MKLTAEEVLKAALNDPNLREHLEANNPVGEAIKPYVLASAVTLKDMLDTRVSLQTLCEAKCLFLRNCIQNGYGETMTRLLGLDGDRFGGMLSNILDALEGATKDTDAFCKGIGLTEEQVMVSELANLNSNNLKKWYEGTLTIGGLLVTQPSVIMVNT